MIDYDKNGWLPKHIKKTMKHYFENGIYPGQGLRHILQDNLSEAFFYSDDICSKKMHDILKWLCSEAPSSSWGSKENFKNWIEKIEKESEETIRYRNRKADSNDNEPL